MSQIQRQLKAPKGQFNNFAKYKFRSCEDIVEAVKPLLIDGCVLHMSDDVHAVGGCLYIKATASLLFGESSIQASGWARESLNKKGMDEGQMTGTASSYARKYALNGLFAIDDTKDADTNEYSKQNEPKVSKAPKKELTPQQKEAKAQETADKIKDEYKLCTNLGMMSDVQGKHKDVLLVFRERYSKLDAEVNAVGLQVLGGFDKH